MIPTPDNMTPEQEALFEAQKKEVIRHLEIQMQYCVDIGGEEFKEFFSKLPSANVQKLVGEAWIRLVNEFKMPEVPARPISRLIDRSFINGCYTTWRALNGKN